MDERLVCPFLHHASYTAAPLPQDNPTWILLPCPLRNYMANSRFGHHPASITDAFAACRPTDYRQTLHICPGLHQRARVEADGQTRSLTVHHLPTRICTACAEKPLWQLYCSAPSNTKLTIA